MIHKTLNFILLYVSICTALDTIQEFHRQHPDKSRWHWGDPYNGIPVMLGTLFPNQNPIEFSAGCFQNYTATFSGDSNGGTLTLTAQNAANFYCTDLLLILDMQTWYAKEIYMHGTYNEQVSWKTGEWDAVLQNGFQIFEIRSGIMGELVDLYEFYSLMTAESDPEYVMQFLTKHSNWDFTPRSQGFINLNHSEVMSGDYIAVMELDGDSLLITYGTGSKTDHVAMALWIDSELYVIESCTKGVRRTPWDDWMDNRPDWSMIGLLRLRPDLLKKFNSTAAYEHFIQLEGNEYGWQNFVYGWIDTPSLNFPPPLLSQNVPIALALVEQMKPDIANSMVIDGLNLRLNTSGLGTLQIQNVLNALNMTWGQLWSMPESDAFRYPSRPSGSPSLVCSSFAMSVYRAAGIFDDLIFEATEITPKDSYQLEIFDGDWNRPLACRYDNLPYCQLNGGWRLDLLGFNTVPMIPHVDQKCGAMPPMYIRTPPVC